MAYRKASRGTSRRSYSRNAGRSRAPVGRNRKSYSRGGSRGGRSVVTHRLEIVTAPQNPVARPFVPGLPGVAQEDTRTRKARF